MKVKVRKLTFAQRVAERMAEWHEKERAEEHEREMIIKRLVELRPENAEERLAADAKWRQYESQQKKLFHCRYLFIVYNSDCKDNDLLAHTAPPIVSQTFVFVT